MSVADNDAGAKNCEAGKTDTTHGIFDGCTTDLSGTPEDNSAKFCFINGTSAEARLRHLYSPKKEAYLVSVPVTSAGNGCSRLKLTLVFQRRHYMDTPYVEESHDARSRVEEGQCGAPEEILVEPDAEEFTVGFRWLLAVDDEPWTLADYCFSWMRSLARHGSGTPLNPLRVEYVQQRSNVRQIERSLGCDVVVGAPRNVIVFRASDATKPFVTRNVELLDLLARNSRSSCGSTRTRTVFWS
jgi:hypothetical protein